MRALESPLTEDPIYNAPAIRPSLATANDARIRLNPGYHCAHWYAIDVCYIFGFDADITAAHV
jgi:hypothetical protein